MPYRLHSSLTYLLGKIYWDGSRYNEDKDAQLIREVIKSDHLEVCSSNVWGVVYRNLEDDRLWLLREYIDMIGPGPRVLTVIPKQTYNAVFKRDWTDINILDLRERMFRRTYPKLDEFMLCGICYNRPIYDGLRDKIEWLVSSVFHKKKSLNMDTLFWDQRNKTYWELVNVDYPPDALGGGAKTLSENPRFLHQIDHSTAIRKYN